MGNRPVRIGVQLKPQHVDYSDLRRMVADVEELGADVVFNWDHFFPLSGDPDGKHFECWTMLAAWAEATESIEIGALVTCNSYRNPQLLADMARTVDHISAKAGEGRLVLGLGSGWFARDYEEYGYEFGTAGGRLNALARDLPILKRRWADLNPAPTRQIPILIGGGGEQKTLRIVAEHATIWHGFGEAETIAHKHAVLDEWCRKVGRDPGEIERSAGASEARGRDDEVSTDIVADAEGKYAVGSRLITIGVQGPQPDWGLLKALLDWRDEKNRS